MSEYSSLNERQQAVIDENTAQTLLTGLITRYHKVLRGNVKVSERLAAHEGEDPFWSGFGKKAELARLALRAEAPVAFSLEPSNMTVSVHMIKADPETGDEMPFSSVQIGLMGGLAGDGRPNNPFSQQDLTLAADRIRTQRAVGLYYGFVGGDSVFF